MRKKSTLIIYHEEYFLLLKKKGEKRFSFLGGHLEKGEDPKSAAIREAHEEGNISINSDKIVFFNSYLTKKKNDRKLIYYFICNEIPSYQLMEPHKFDSLQWVHYKAARKHMKKHNKNVLNKIISKLDKIAV